MEFQFNPPPIEELIDIYKQKKRRNKSYFRG